MTDWKPKFAAIWITFIQKALASKWYIIVCDLSVYEEGRAQVPAASKCHSWFQRKFYDNATSRPVTSLPVIISTNSVIFHASPGGRTGISDYTGKGAI